MEERIQTEGQTPTKPTARDIEHAVQQHLGLTTPLQCTRVAEGGEHAAWYIGTGYIFRALPYSHDSIAALAREAAVRDLIRQSQSEVKIIPACVGTITIDGWIGNLDIRVRGASLEERYATQKTETDLIRVVRHLWSTPVPAAEAIVGSEWETVEFDDLIPRAREGWDQLLKTGYVIDHENIMATLLEISDDAREPSENETGVLLHNDFKGEHILLQTSNDDNDGALAGVIDWSDAAIGDVAVDVGGLAISVGQRMAKRIVLDAGVSHSAVERGIAMARCDSMINLNECVNRDDRDSPEWLLRRQFQRAFENTVLENALV
jgi:aminoglycoside phosphotransferase (APT) family kinase protein